MHAAVAAVDPEPGDEIITTPITDMGALTPILYQGAIPVFADVDPLTGNVTPDSVKARIRISPEPSSSPTVGNPVETDDIMAVARTSASQSSRSSPGAPSFGEWASGRGRRRHRLSSLQQGKHITTGEGGLLVTSDDTFARRIRLFVNKAWPYGEVGPDHEFLALNYRMSELQGAVAVAQLSDTKRT